MNDEILKAYHEAYVGESKAALRLKMYADQAEEDGYTQLAKLFRVISFSEEIHGLRNLRALGQMGTTEENLQKSFESEVNVSETEYGRLIKLAEKHEDQMATLLFSQMQDVEEVHGKLYKEAMGHMMEDRETSYHVCTVCGYVSDGVLPDTCPVCGVDKDQFVPFK